MRKLNAGDVAGKLARIANNASRRSRRYRRRAARHLLADQQARSFHTSHRLAHNGQTVCSKRRHATLEAARQELACAQRSGLHHRQESRAYRCGYCGGWHLTSKDYLPIEELRYDHTQKIHGDYETGYYGKGHVYQAENRSGSANGAGVPASFIINVSEAIAEARGRAET